MQPLALWVWAHLPCWLSARLAWVLAAKLNVGVCALVLQDPEHVFLAAHTYKPAAPWQLPGGYLRAGEQPEAGLRREVQEELGLVLQSCRLVHAAALPRHVTLVYLAAVSGTVVPSAEVAAWRAFPLAALPSSLPPEQRRAILQVTGQTVAA